MAFVLRFWKERKKKKQSRFQHFSGDVCFTVVLKKLAYDFFCFFCSSAIINKEP